MNQHLLIQTERDEEWRPLYDAFRNPNNGFKTEVLSIKLLLENFGLPLAA